jgi:hypothetical protein
MNRYFQRLAAAGLVGGATFLAVETARAQTRLSHSNWRAHDRASLRGEQDRGSALQHFMFEVRLGSYYPQVDEEFSGTGPYARAFDVIDSDGNLQEKKTRLYFGLELDWLPLRVPYVGALGPGFGWGYMSASEKAKLAADPTQASGQETSLTIMPMHLSAVVRFDELMRRTSIPIVPYAKLGLGLGLWTAGEGSSTASYEEQTADEAVTKTSGRDTTWGTHLALGGMLSLSWIDRDSASSMYQSTDLRNLYLFGEWMYANLDGIGSRPQMHVGSSSFVGGVALEM